MSSSSFMPGAGQCLTDGPRCYNLTSKRDSAGHRSVSSHGPVCQERVCLCESEALSDRMGFS